MNVWNLSAIKLFKDAAMSGDKIFYSYVSKSDRLGSSDVWLKSPGT